MHGINTEYANQTALKIQEAVTQCLHNNLTSCMMAVQNSHLTFARQNYVSNPDSISSASKFIDTLAQSSLSEKLDNLDAYENGKLFKNTIGMLALQKDSFAETEKRKINNLTKFISQHPEKVNDQKTWNKLIPFLQQYGKSVVEKLSANIVDSSIDAWCHHHPDCSREQAMNDLGKVFKPDIRACFNLLDEIVEDIARLSKNNGTGMLQDMRRLNAALSAIPATLNTHKASKAEPPLAQMPSHLGPQGNNNLQANDPSKGFPFGPVNIINNNNPNFSQNETTDIHQRSGLNTPDSKSADRYVGLAELILNSDNLNQDQTFLLMKDLIASLPSRDKSVITADDYHNLFDNREKIVSNIDFVQIEKPETRETGVNTFSSTDTVDLESITNLVDSTDPEDALVQDLTKHLTGSLFIDSDQLDIRKKSGPEFKPQVIFDTTDSPLSYDETDIAPENDSSHAVDNRNRLSAADHRSSDKQETLVTGSEANNASDTERSRSSDNRLTSATAANGGVNEDSKTTGHNVSDAKTDRVRSAANGTTADAANTQNGQSATGARIVSDTSANESDDTTVNKIDHRKNTQINNTFNRYSTLVNFSGASLSSANIETKGINTNDIAKSSTLYQFAPLSDIKNSNATYIQRMSNAKPSRNEKLSEQSLEIQILDNQEKEVVVRSVQQILGHETRPEATPLNKSNPKEILLDTLKAELRLNGLENDPLISKINLGKAGYINSIEHYIKSAFLTVVGSDSKNDIRQKAISDALTLFKEAGHMDNIKDSRFYDFIKFSPMLNKRIFTSEKTINILDNVKWK